MIDAIATHELTKIYPRTIGRRPVLSLDSLTLSVRPNEVFGFLGRNGAGKTTTIKLLCGLLRPTSGTAAVFGEDLRSRRARLRIGYLPENPFFYEYLTPRETLDFYGRLNGLDAAARSREWEKLSDLLDLRSIAEQQVRGFSKGMRQRLGFAVALVGDPDLLILDEPMSGLDPMGRRAIRTLILRMRDEGKTIFFSSHILGDVEQICDRVGILVKGVLTSQGRIDELVTQRIHQVEVVVAGLTPDAAAAIAKGATTTRASEAGNHFYFQYLEQANQAAREALALGGALVEFTPVKQTLEDHFVQVQDVKS